MIIREIEFLIDSACLSKNKPYILNNYRLSMHLIKRKLASNVEKNHEIIINNDYSVFCVNCYIFLNFISFLLLNSPEIILMVFF